MKWKIVVALSGFGVAMGFASVFGLTGGREGLLWLLIGFIAALVIARQMASGHFQHGFGVGIIWGLVASFIQIALFSTYLANNPESAKQLQQVPGGLNPRFFILVLAPVIGLATGLLLGALAWVAAKVIRRKSPALSQ